jgi:hypothetical protein
VNLGGLGFLTAITLDQLYPELECALCGEQRVVPRSMLHGEVVRDGKTVASYEALNDIVIGKTQIARMIDLETYVDSQFVSTFKADGLIVATPTGSTAYSLSAGGPILFPAVAAICITPVCPHMLTNRPVLVPDTSVIEIISKAPGKEAYLTVDGQVGEPLIEDDRVVCRSSEHKVYLIRPPKMFFFDVLREKLKWGEGDPGKSERPRSRPGSSSPCCWASRWARSFRTSAKRSGWRARQRVPAPDQIHHRAADLRHSGLRHRRHWQRQDHGPHRHQSHRLFRSSHHHRAGVGIGRRQPGAAGRGHDAGTVGRRNRIVASRSHISGTLEHTFPASVIDAMAKGDVLQIVVFSFLFGAACAAIGSKAAPVVTFCKSLSEVMFRYTKYVMYLAPIGVGAAMASTIGSKGLGVLLGLGKLDAHVVRNARDLRLCRSGRGGDDRANSAAGLSSARFVSRSSSRFPPRRAKPRCLSRSKTWN